MGYWRIKKGVFIEIIVSSLIGMLISLICVIYLTNKILKLNEIINVLKNQEPAIIYIEQQVDTEEPQEKRVNLSSRKETSASIDDRELLARLLYCEGRGESIECQRAIISVIINRLNSGSWGNSISSVIYAKGQFEPIASGLINSAKPSNVQYEVVDYILENGSTLPNWVMFFRASYHFNWKNYTPYCNIDNTYFGGFKK